MKDVKRLEGQPWSAWKTLFLEQNNIGGAGPQKESSEDSYCTKLPRSDMALFGLCPKTEIFELAVCNYCGNKYKLSAFADHIRLRHFNCLNTSQKIVHNILRDENKSTQKKGGNKGRKTKALKPKDKLETATKNQQLDLDVKVNLIELNFKVLEKGISKEEKLSDQNMVCDPKVEATKELTCNGSHDSSLLKPLLNKDSSTISKDNEVINLQPVVQLTPLCANNKALPPAATIVLEAKSTVEPEQTVTCLNEKNSLSVTVSHKGSNLSSNDILEINSHISSRPSGSVDTLSNNDSSSNNSLESGAKKTMREKSTKRGTNEKPKLSLPVSIKNPTYCAQNAILTQLQNNMLKSKLALSRSCTRTRNIQDIFKTLSSKQLRTSRNRYSKENSRAQQSIPKKVTESESLESKISENKEGRFTMWCPGFRRTGGLLFSKQNLPRVGGNNKKNTNNSVPLPRKKDELTCIISEQNSSNNSGKTDIVDCIVNNINHKIENKKIQLDCEPSAKRNSTVQGRLIGQTSLSNHSKKAAIQQKVSSNPSLNINKPVVCKRLNTNLNGTVPNKMKKQDGIINLVGSVYEKEQTLPVMHMEVANNVFEKKLIAPAQNITPSTIDISCVSTLPTGFEVISSSILRGSSIRIETPRIHYFTSPLQASANSTQLQLKPMTVQHKYQLVSQQINIAPSGGVYFLPKTTATSNSSNMNGVEEK